MSRWYIKTNSEELTALEAMKELDYAKNNGWQDYLILPTKTSFNILRGLEEFLGDQNHSNGLYQIFNERGKRPTLQRINIFNLKATYSGVMMTWAPDAKVLSFYYQKESDLDLVKRFGLKNPILIKCPS
jgi:hypothetical protein